MKRKLIGIYIVFIFISTSMSTMFVLADEPEPQITDPTGDAFGYIDIVDILFFEKQETPEFLYVSMKINEPSFSTFQQTFAVFWKYDKVQYSCGLHLGFRPKDWEAYNAGKYERGKRNQDLQDIEGDYDFEDGVITWTIPKELIGSPSKGDVLYDTWSNAFRRLGFIGRIGFTRIILDKIILDVFGNNMWDYAPAEGSYGDNYTIQY
jgi:hypothetical protein